jgi:hypothetical protein
MPRSFRYFQWKYITSSPIDFFFDAYTPRMTNGQSPGQIVPDTCTVWPSFHFIFSISFRPTMQAFCSAMNAWNLESSPAGMATRACGGEASTSPKSFS